MAGMILRSGRALGIAAIGGFPIELVDQGAQVMMAGGQAAVANMVGPGGERMGELAAGAYGAFTAAIFAALNWSRDTGGGSHPISPSQLMALFGEIPKPVRPVRTIRFSECMNIRWPCHPKWSHTAPHLALNNTTLDFTLHDVDATWLSPALPAAGDVAISDFMWPVMPLDDPFSADQLITSATAVTNRKVPFELLETFRIHRRFAAVRFNISFSFTLNVENRVGIYIALVCPRDMTLGSYTIATGARVEGSDRAHLPSWARTSASIATDAGAGSEFEPAAFAASTFGVRQRLDHMTHDQYYCWGWVYFPPNTKGVLRSMPSTASHFGPWVQPGKTPRRSLALDSTVEELTTSPVATYSPEETSSWNPWTFQGTMSFGPASPGVNYRYAWERPDGWVDQVITGSGGVGVYPGCRLVWMADGPGADETITTTGHDQIASDFAAETPVSQPTAGKQSGAITVKSHIGAQFVFSDPDPQFLDLMHGTGDADG